MEGVEEAGWGGRYRGRIEGRGRGGGDEGGGRLLEAVNANAMTEDVPLGAAKWITFPSSLNIFTSSIAWIGCTLSFLSEVCSFLSSVPDVLCTFFCFLRGVPLPLNQLE